MNMIDLSNEFSCSFKLEKICFCDWGHGMVTNHTCRVMLHRHIENCSCSLIMRLLFVFSYAEIDSELDVLHQLFHTQSAFSETEFIEFMTRLR